ncbi:unnamed protein product [Orchesella dallaii]|uniref:Carboxylesterase type B domain-containing protein n=1 Tax=Orchesella dallaii TaxID=48710 RepID=A0ABP1QL07_9HEXA
MEPSSTMLQCLRELPLRYFLESELWNLFGPSGDGIVVQHSLPSESVIMNRISHYPMIFGVVRAEFLPWLNNHDATYGLESERRRELLRQFIRKHYSFHRNEILAGAIHEYTDWEKPAQHPLNVRDETIDALADAQVVAPLTKVGDLHAASSRTKAYFYIFDYQSKNSEYQQRVGCVHGEDLLYVFGVPLYFYENEFTSTAASHVDDDQQNGLTKPGDIIMAGKTAGEFARKEKWRKRNERSGGLGFFGGNYTWYEVQLSATVIQLWANFIRTGNPNGDLKSQVKVAHGMGTGSSGTSTYQQQQPKGRPQGKSRKVKDESEVKEEELLQLVTGTGVTYSDNRLRLSRDNLMALPTPFEEQHQRQLLQQHHHHYHQPKPILVEWPEYDSLDKKYLILDLRPKIRNHYRAHKLSFWLHLVPDYQKNNEGTGAVSIHHDISVYSMMPPQNLSKLSVIQPTIFASGLHDTAAGLGKTRYNSSGAIDSGDSSASGSKRTGELVSGGSRKSRPGNSNKGVGAAASAPAGDFEERQKQQDSAILHVSSSNNMDPLESTFGFHTYSTALSVTIAIGCSLLILNILIFATFYYEREKRRQEHHRQKQLEQEEFNDEQAPHHRRHQQQQQHHHDQNESPQGQFFRKQSTSSIEERFKIPLTTSSMSCGGAGSASASLKRRRENNSAGGSAASCAISSGANGSVVHPDSTTTVFCEHYVNEESDMNLFNDLYTSPYLVEEHEDEEDDDVQLPPLPLPELGMEVAGIGPGGATSSALPDHSISDMSYGKYGAKKHFSKTSLAIERGFIPISPARGTPTNGNSSYTVSSLRNSESIRQKRKAFAIASNSSGGLNEFSMSDVMAEPVTNVPNFSPQSTTATITTRSELFEIERIPTAEELIEANVSNAAQTAGGDTTSSQPVSLVPPPVIPDFVGHHQESTITGAGRFFQNEQETGIRGTMVSQPSCQLSQQRVHLLRTQQPLTTMTTAHQHQTGSGKDYSSTDDGQSVLSVRIDSPQAFQ